SRARPRERRGDQRASPHRPGEARGGGSHGGADLLHDAPALRASLGRAGDGARGQAASASLTESGPRADGEGHGAVEVGGVLVAFELDALVAFDAALAHPAAQGRGEVELLILVDGRDELDAAVLAAEGVEERATDIGDEVLGRRRAGGDED